MENISERILLFHNLYLVCLAGMVVFLGISVFLFIRLDIRNVIGYYTGWQAKREIKKMEVGSREKNREEEHIGSELRNPPGDQKSRELEIRKVKSFTEVTMTKRLSDGSGEVTGLLRLNGDDNRKTTLLYQDDRSFFIEREILLIHTDEIIV